jgi:hypothetical protein
MRSPEKAYEVVTAALPTSKQRTPLSSTQLSELGQELKRLLSVYQNGFISYEEFEDRCVSLLKQNGVELDIPALEKLFRSCST